MDGGPLLARQLDLLIRETFALWPPGWCTFNWRAYTYDHVQRVRGLAATLCQRTGGDIEVTELAALLHDITKPYDGEYVLGPDGQRAVDADGMWRNQVRQPTGRNHVTDLYDALHLAGSLHNQSGAEIATHILRDRGLTEDKVAQVAAAIRDHLQPPPDAPIESCCLYDADTIDANIGLPAFVRNIYIHLHFRDQRRQPEEPSTDDLLRETPLDYLMPYVRDNLPRWTEGKQRDFVPRLRTPAARVLAGQRLARLTGIWAAMSEELDSFATASSQHGCLAVMLHYMRHRDEPSIAGETAYLAGTWLPSNGATPGARSLVEHLLHEMAGLE
ncbi:MAG: HD domain-containing protein [Anaerolineae bacterium]